MSRNVWEAPRWLAGGSADELGRCVSDPNPLLDTTRMLSEARRILDGVEATALGGVAQMLAETAESLARTARELKGISPDEWLTFEEAAAYLKKTPKAFEKVVARGEVPKHYLTSGLWRSGGG